MSGQLAQAYLGIGEVLVELRAEFPDISVSKIRFLESEGLITPARSPSGYRRFGPSDVDQLRFILTAQRDQYLPLRVIKERLEQRSGDIQRTSTGQRTSTDQRAGDEQRAGNERTEMVGRRELLEAAGIDDAALAELEAHGLVRRVGRLYGQDALDVAATAAALASYGVQARHLRAVRTAVDRDTALIEQVVAPTLRQRSPHARDAAGRTAREIATLLLRLHRAMIESALAEAGLPGDELPEPDSRPAPRAGLAAAQPDAGPIQRGVRGASA
jgi:DNA-binding transcriptional MerR regulator